MRKNVIIIVVAVIILCMIMTGVIYAGVRFYTRPQAPTLSLVTPTASKATPVISKTSETKSVVVEVPTEIPTKVPQVCGQSGNWTILVLGRTIHLDPAPAQMIRLMKVNFDQKSAVMYSIPPDLVLETPGLIAKYKIQTSRVQDIFTAIVIADGKSAATNVNATQATAQAILDNLGFTPDHYITIDENFVMDMVNTVGGIDVVLSQDFTMPSYSPKKGLVLKAGKNHLDGEMVHALTTYRSSSADELSRLARQNVIIEGMRQKLLDPAVYVKIPELYSIYKENITTDLSLEQIAALSCLTRLIPPENITIRTPDLSQMIIKADGAVYFKDPALIVNEIQSLFKAP